MKWNHSNLKPGDWVEVRSREEILKTLDDRGRLEGMPFMPEMFQFCGKRFQVYKRAHKTCDYTTPYPCHTRWLNDAVHLDTRCDGSAHGGCEARCLVIWKEAWLQPVGDGPKGTVALRIAKPNLNATVGCQESAVWNNTQRAGSSGDDLVYICQATTTPDGTAPLAWWDIRQYLEDYFSGNVSLGRLFKGLIYSMYFNLSQAGIGLGPPMRWFWDKFHWAWRGSLFPRKKGFIPEGKPTPAVNLNLQPGEWVRVKPHLEILKTVDVTNKNRGMHWDAELVPYCGKVYRVLKRVHKLIDERSGKMMNMKTACIILDTVVCQARYSPNRMLCPKSMYPYWREIWLERVEAEPKVEVGTQSMQETH